MAIERQGRGRWKPIRDISRNIGVPLYSFSFFGNRLRRVKSLDLGCEDNYLRKFIDELEKIKGIISLTSSTTMSSYCDEKKFIDLLNPEILPDILIHKLKVSKFR